MIYIVCEIPSKVIEYARKKLIFLKKFFKTHFVMDKIYTQL